MCKRKPENQDLLAQVQVLQKQVAALQSDNAALRAENAELQLCLNRNSRNSSKPPSSDGLSKPPAKKDCSLRKTGQCKSGGQPGHKGHTLKQVSAPNHVVKHGLFSCPDCSVDLSGVDTLWGSTIIGTKRYSKLGFDFKIFCYPFLHKIICFSTT